MKTREVTARTVPQQGPDAGALTGAMISGGFGIAWTQWGASGLAGVAAVVVRVAAIVVGLTIVLRAARLRRSAPEVPEGASTFASTAYRVVVALEVAALVGGTVVLGVADHSEYVVAWFALAVGLHFVAFGRLIDVRFYVVGALVSAAGVAGAVVGAIGGGLDGIAATTGLGAGAALFGAGLWTLQAARRS